MTPTYNTMSLRAEYQFDITKLMGCIPIRRMELQGDDRIPDVVIQFDTSMSLEEVKHHLSMIEGGHVMFETVAQATIENNPMKRT